MPLPGKLPQEGLRQAEEGQGLRRGGLRGQVGSARAQATLRRDRPLLLRQRVPLRRPGVRPGCPHAPLGTPPRPATHTGE